MTQAQSIKRPLGQTESLYFLLDQLYCLNFVVFAQLEGEVTVAALNAALLAAQAEHPLLRTRIVTEQQHLRFRPVEAAQYSLQASWLPWRGWRTELQRQLNDPFGDEAPLARCFACVQKTAKGSHSMVALVFHHAIADGRSATQLLMDVLRRAGGEQRPLDYRAAQPAAQQLDALERQPLLTRGLQKTRFWLGQTVNALTPLGKSPSSYLHLGQQRQIEVLPFIIKQRLASQLAKACKAQGTSVHGALGAAQMLALADVAETSQPSHLALNSLADLRGTLDGELTEHDLGLYIATLTTVHRLALSGEVFWPLAVDIRGQLTALLDSGAANQINALYQHNSLRLPTRARAAVLQGLAALAPAASMLTNIGRVAPVTLANGATVTTLEFIVAPPPQCHFCITAASYQGVIYLNLLYDTAKFAPQQAEQLRDRLLEQVARAVITADAR